MVPLTHTPIAAVTETQTWILGSSSAGLSPWPGASRGHSIWSFFMSNTCHHSWIFKKIFLIIFKVILFESGPRWCRSYILFSFQVLFYESFFYIFSHHLHFEDTEMSVLSHCCSLGIWLHEACAVWIRMPLMQAHIFECLFSHHPVALFERTMKYSLVGGYLSPGCTFRFQKPIPSPESLSWPIDLCLTPTVSSNPYMFPPLNHLKILPAIMTIHL